METNAVPCGECGACKDNKRQDWMFRLKEEYRDSKNGYFVTLTYDQDNIEYSEDGIPTLVKKDLQNFMKRLRKKQSKLTDVKIRFYGLGEYGSKTERPHYHLLLFNVALPVTGKITNIWGLGHTKVGTITDGSIHYVTSYHVTEEKKEFIDEKTGVIYEREDEFTTMSTRPGIGYGYVERMKKWHNENEAYYVIDNGYMKRMPEYYKDKIFSGEMRKKLADQAKLDAWDNEEKEIERLKKLIPGLPYYYGSEIQKRMYKEAKQKEGKKEKNSGKF